jgi:glycosyltransferase involved in cell wall biosynthesis
MKDYDKNFLIANSDPVEFADKILWVFDDRALYQRLSAESVKLAGKYKIREYTKKLLALYELD